VNSRLYASQVRRISDKPPPFPAPQRAANNYDYARGSLTILGCSQSGQASYSSGSGSRKGGRSGGNPCISFPESRSSPLTRHGRRFLKTVRAGPICIPYPKPNALTARLAGARASCEIAWGAAKWPPEHSKFEHFSWPGGNGSPRPAKRPLLPMRFPPLSVEKELSTCFFFRLAKGWMRPVYQPHAALSAFRITNRPRRRTTRIELVESSPKGGPLHGLRIPLAEPMTLHAFTRNGKLSEGVFGPIADSVQS